MKFTGSSLHLVSIYHISKLNLYFSYAPIFSLHLKEKKKKKRKNSHISCNNIPFHFPYYLQILFYFVSLPPLSVFTIPFLSLSQHFFRPVHIPFRSFFTALVTLIRLAPLLYLYLSSACLSSVLAFFLPSVSLVFPLFCSLLCPLSLHPPLHPHPLSSRCFFFHPFFTIVRVAFSGSRSLIRYAPLLFSLSSFISRISLSPGRCLFSLSYSFSLSVPTFRFSFSSSPATRLFLFPLAIIFLLIHASTRPFLRFCL